MRRLVASLMVVLVVVLAVGCGGPASPSPTGSPSPAASGSPAGSADPSAGSGGGPLGEPLATIEAELTAQGFTFADQAADGGAAIGRLGTAPQNAGQMLLVGDPVAALMWRTSEPFLDLGPVHLLLRARAREDVGAWVDEQMQALMSTTAAHQAQAAFGGDPVLFVGTHRDDGTIEVGLLMGDVASLGIPLPSPVPTDPAASDGPPEALGAAMTGYGALATTANAELTLALAVLLDEQAALADRAAAAQRVAMAESAFDQGLSTITFPAAAQEPAASLAGLTQATVLASQPLHTAATVGELDAALPGLLDALRAEAAAAADLRAALLSYGSSFAFFAASPPPVNAGPVVAVAGELVVNGDSLSLEGGDGSVAAYIDNPTGAFAIGVSITVEIYAYEGPLVESRTLGLEVVAPGTTGVATQEIRDMNPPGLTPQSVKVTAIEVESWRAADDPPLLGR